MLLINIDNLVTFAPNIGVLVHESALDVPPNRLAEVIRLAFSHLQDPPLVLACCSGSGPLVGYSHLTYAEYLVKLKEIEVAEAGKRAKRTYSALRRKEFNNVRPQLVLKMIEVGFPYQCAAPGCEVREGLTVDHVIPLSRGGSDDLENLQFMCPRHNSIKRDHKTI